MIDFGNLALEVFNVLRAFNYDVKLFDGDGNSVPEPSDARRFFSKAEDLMIAIVEDAENSTLHVTHSKSIQIAEILGFLETLRNICNKFNVLFTVRAYGDVIKPQNFVRTPLGEDRKDTMDLTENMYGTSRSSYLKLENARLIVKHSSKVDEAVSGSRSRRIDRMFVENKQGERHLLPTKYLSAGKAMAQHVSHGGMLTDDVGQRLCEMAKDYANLGSAIRHIRKHGASLNEEAGTLKEHVTRARVSMRGLFEKVLRNYDAGVEQLKGSMLNETSDEDMATARTHVGDVLHCEGAELDEAVIESVARSTFNLEKEPLEEKQSDLVQICDTNVEREVFLRFAENSELDFSKSPNVEGVSGKDDDSLANAMDRISRVTKDDGMANLFDKVGSDLIGGAATTLARQIAQRALKIAKEKNLVESLRNPVIREHIEWLESFTIENILLDEDKDEGSDCKKCEGEDEELSKEDVVLPKSSSRDLEREVVKKKSASTTELLLDDEEEPTK